MGPRPFFFSEWSKLNRTPNPGNVNVAFFNNPKSNRGDGPTGRRPLLFLICGVLTYASA
jgi:hypothetical protein